MSADQIIRLFAALILVASAATVLAAAGYAGWSAVTLVFGAILVMVEKKT